MNRLTTRILLGATLAGALFTPARAQRVEIRAAGVSRDTVYLLPGDAIPLSLVGKTAAGGTVTPTKIAWFPKTHCTAVEAGPADVSRAILSELDCGLVPGWIVAEGLVSGAYRVDSVYVGRPNPPASSDLGICLTWKPRALMYAARDTIIALALQGADRRIAANFVPDSAAPQWHWQGARLLVQYAAIACMPGYAAKDITRLTATRWTSGDLTIATVDRYGLATWKTARAPMVISAAWPVK